MSPFKGPAGNGLDQLTGDVTAGPGTGSQAATLAAVGTAGTVGDTTHYPIVTVDAKGRVTSMTAQAAPSGAVTSVFTRTGAVVAGDADYLAVSTGGLTGAVAATRYVGGTASGAPTTGTFAVGDFVVDQTGKIWICTAAGTPGTWGEVGAGGITQLTGDVTAGPGTGSQVATLAAVGTAGTYGSATAVPEITTDAKGRVTGVTTVAPDDATKVALSTVTTAGDLIVASGAGAVTRLGVGTSSQVLLGGATPTWGAAPASVATDLFTYVSNYGSGSVSVIRNSDGVVVATVTVGTNPYGVAVTPDGSYVYVTNLNSNNVSVIATATNTVTATITVGTGPVDVAVTPNGSYVYVANLNSNNVSVIATATNTVTATITVGTGPFGVAVTPNGSYVYVANLNSNNVSVIATATNTVTTTVTVGTNPYGVAVTPNGSYVYVSNFGSGSVSVIATATNTVTTTVTVGTSPRGVAVTPNGSYVYVANYGSNSVSVIATATNTVTATVTVGTNPYGVAVTPNGSYVYVSNFGSGSVSVIATATNTVTTTITVGTSPFGVAVTMSVVPPPNEPSTRVNNSGTATYGASASAPAVTSGTAFTPNAYTNSMVYFQINAATAGSYTLTMGPTTGAEHTIASAAAVTIGNDVIVDVLVPVGWLVVLTLTTVTLGSTLVVSC